MVAIRAQVILNRYTSLPEDIVTNTFHFNTAGALTDAIGTEIVAKLSAFYGAIDQHLSPVLLPNVSVKLFDLSAPAPRNPFNPGWGFPIVPGTGNTGLPEEVACVLSLHAALPHTPRRRGRLFLGPMNTNAMFFGGPGNPAEWNAAFRNTLTAAAVALRDAAGNTLWSIWSEADAVNRPVRGGWVDSAADTQRRREMSARARQLWGSLS